MSKRPRRGVQDHELALRIHRLFDEPLSPDDVPCPWFCESGGTVDCNTLLSVVDDGDFIDAAVWQIHGCEIAGHKRRKWIKRLGWSSRMSIVMGLRLKTAGRKHAVKIPGLWFAFSLDPPGRRYLGPYAGRLLDRIRQRIVAWRFRRFTRNSTSESQTPFEPRRSDLKWKQVG